MTCHALVAPGFLQQGTREFLYIIFLSPTDLNSSLMGANIPQPIAVAPSGSLWLPLAPSGSLWLPLAPSSSTLDGMEVYSSTVNKWIIITIMILFHSLSCLYVWQTFLITNLTKSIGIDDKISKRNICKWNWYDEWGVIKLKGTEHELLQYHDSGHFCLQLYYAFPAYLLSNKDINISFCSLDPYLEMYINHNLRLHFNDRVLYVIKEATKTIPESRVHNTSHYWWYNRQRVVKEINLYDCYWKGILNAASRSGKNKSNKFLIGGKQWNLESCIRSTELAEFRDNITRR